MLIDERIKYVERTDFPDTRLSWEALKSLESEFFLFLQNAPVFLTESQLWHPRKGTEGQRFQGKGSEAIYAREFAQKRRPLFCRHFLTRGKDSVLWCHFISLSYIRSRRRDADIIFSSHRQK